MKRDTHRMLCNRCSRLRISQLEVYKGRVSLSRRAEGRREQLKHCLNRFMILRKALEPLREEMGSSPQLEVAKRAWLKLRMSRLSPEYFPTSKSTTWTIALWTQITTSAPPKQKMSLASLKPRWSPTWLSTFTVTAKNQAKPQKALHVLLKANCNLLCKSKALQTSLSAKYLKLDATKNWTRRKRQMRTSSICRQPYRLTAAPPESKGLRRLAGYLMMWWIWVA